MGIKKASKTRTASSTPTQETRESVPLGLETVLFDERFVGRTETLRKFFTPREGYETVVSTPEQIFETPQGIQALLNPRSSFIAPQSRESYDHARIERLGRNLREGYGQLQNCGVALVDNAHIEEYLRDMNRFFDTNISLEELTPHPNFGGYLITVFGHNRQLALASSNLQTSGNPDSGLLMEAKVYVNPSYWQVIEMQQTENTGESPAIWSRARSIIQYQTLRARDGFVDTKKRVAALFNVDEDQIWRAERYESLPGSIKLLVEENKIPYSGALELDVLIPFYGIEEVEAIAKRLADSKASSAKILDDVKRRIAATHLTPEIRNIIDEGQLTLTQAQELVKLRKYVSESEVNDFAMWICTHRPDIETIRKKAKETISTKLNGNVGFFDVVSDDDHLLTAQALREYNDSEKKAQVQSAITSITKLLAGLRTALSSGLLGDIVDQDPISNGAPEHLRSVVSLLVETVNSSGTISYSDIEEQLKALRIDPTLDKEVVQKVDMVIGMLAELLELEAHETSAHQAEKRRMLAEKVIQLTPSAPVQDGLF